MSAQWDSLPLLPLRCILDHLSLENVLAATSTCRHWRQAMLLYEGRRNKLILRAKYLEQNMFLARLFRKHTKQLVIFTNGTEEQVDKFMTFVLPHFFEAVALQEVIFIGPIYFYQKAFVSITKLNRVITESLVFKHSNFITKLVIIGCTMDAGHNSKDVAQHKQVEYYSRSLSFPCVCSPEDSILSRCNVDVMLLSSLRHIIFDYEQISTETLETLSKLKNLKQLSLNLLYKGRIDLPSVNWHHAMAEFYGSKLLVAVNIINLPENRFNPIIDTVFVRGMPLTSLKVMFCKTIHIPLLDRLSCMYSNTLRELVWVDTPHDVDKVSREIKCRLRETNVSEAYNHVNPFMVLCWQCVNLQRLVIHGYWIWQYDLLGFVRLRKSLKVEVSSLYRHESIFGNRLIDGDCVLRVMKYDTPVVVDNKFIQEMNTYSERGWLPFPWRQLPNALRFKSNPGMRTKYILKETLKNLSNM